MASKKKQNRYGDTKVAASSLHPFDKDGFMTKQGGSYKNWNKRYFILKDRSIFYYKGQKDAMFTGRIDLESNSVVKEEPGIKKSPNIFSVSTSRRIFFMYPDKSEEVKPWIDAINKAIEKSRANPLPPQENGAARAPESSSNLSNSSQQQTQSTTSSSAASHPPAASTPAAFTSSAEMSPRVRLSLAKGVVNFLNQPESKVLEFWQIWSESIPSKEDLGPGMSIEFQVATSADMQKLTWRTSGPQNVFIQKMVDFFWNVGAPESEIDRLNDVGALINPLKIGSWIDMSAKGGMDGGWYFPQDIPLKLAVESSDDGDAVRRFNTWAEQHNIQNVFTVGRDMGAAPPRQTELKMKVPGNNFDDQLAVGLDAFTAFGFPEIPANALKILRESRPDGPLTLSVITSLEGFVRLGLLAPFPSTETVLALCSISGGNHEEMAAFEASLGKERPSYVEYQYLMKNFGYGVYKEGFDIVFHYIVGEEHSD
eukprot:TRINITY_DN822_c0_g1_i1.p1 TRINITY_DN822_c0_g1~~TRINITY_DN822_c0_g1_i1.p1  ORF type:complete len:482 (-),score=136.28 TRINITY_DN822_c0_g1_i1:109-1554(-)